MLEGTSAKQGRVASGLWPPAVQGVQESPSGLKCVPWKDKIREAGGIRDGFRSTSICWALLRSVLDPGAWRLLLCGTHRGIVGHWIKKQWSCWTRKENWSQQAAEMSEWAHGPTAGMAKKRETSPEQSRRETEDSCPGYWIRWSFLALKVIINL